MNFRLAASLGLLAAVSCAPQVRKTPGAAALPTIALLPMNSEVVDLSASDFIRERLFEKMQERGFPLVDLKTVDAALIPLGITDGGQLSAVSVEDLRGALDAGILCYGTILDYAFKSAVALSQRRVEVELKMVDAGNGSVLWEDRAYGVQTTAGAGAVGDLALHTAGKLVMGLKDSVKKVLPGRKLRQAADTTDVVADVALKRETDEALDKLLTSLQKSLSRFPAP